MRTKYFVAISNQRSKSLKHDYSEKFLFST